MLFWALNQPMAQVASWSSLILKIMTPGVNPLLNGPKTASCRNDRSMNGRKRLLLMCSMPIGSFMLPKRKLPTRGKCVSTPYRSVTPGTATDEAPSRGYREELEHFAYCVRNNKSDRLYEVEDSTLIPRCRGEVALADAVIALTSNLAMRERRRIDFDPKWFDYSSDATPDRSEGDLEMAV